MESTELDLRRLVIIGNSGSGKSHLARKLSDRLGSEVMHLDQLFWEPGGFGKKKPHDLLQAEVRKRSLGESWIVEGVFGDLSAIALENATALIFLNKEWSECECALKERGSQSADQLDPVQAEKHFQELLLWAQAHSARENSRLLKGHSKLDNEFQKTKFEFQNRNQTDE